MKQGFKSIKDILLEVAEEEGLNRTEIKDIWNHQESYIKKKMEQEGVYAIFIPFLGTLSLNVKQFSKEIKGKSRSFYKDFIKKVKDLKNHKNYKKYANAHKKVTGVNRLARYIISRYHTGIEVSKNLIVHSKCWEIIEKYSNGVYEKRDKIITRNKNKQ